MKNYQKRISRGFTLVELLIVIVVIAILALIVIPRLMSATRRAKEANMRENLGRIRHAVMRFQADTGVYPATLPDIVASGTPNGWVGGAAEPVLANTYKGPYLQSSGYTDHPGIPVNPLDPNRPASVATSWDYDPASGNVNVSSSITGNTVEDNSPYSQL